jgi:hypothetical protein
LAPNEATAIALIRQYVRPGTIIHPDEASGWERLHADYDMWHINHPLVYSLDGACTNQALFQPPSTG